MWKLQCFVFYINIYVCRGIAVRYAVVVDRVQSWTHAHVSLCRVASMFSVRAPLASDQILCALQQCFNNNLLQEQTCAPSLHILSPALSRLSDQGEQSEAQLCKTSFHVISVSRVILLGLGGSTLDRCDSHLLRLIATPHSLLSKSLPFSAKSLVSLCLPPSSCPLVFIASYVSIPGSLYYVYVVLFLFLYLRYLLQWPHPTPSTSQPDDCTNAFIEDCILLHYAVCHFATSLLFAKKSITHQIKQ